MCPFKFRFSSSTEFVGSTRALIDDLKKMGGVPSLRALKQLGQHRHWRRDVHPKIRVDVVHRYLSIKPSQNRLDQYRVDILAREDFKFYAANKSKYPNAAASRPSEHCHPSYLQHQPKSNHVGWPIWIRASLTRTCMQFYCIYPSL